MHSRKPAYLLHKPSGQARVRINGKDHYLGPYGSQESKDLYHELIAPWLRVGDLDRIKLTIDELCLLHLKHAEAYYRLPDGSMTSEVCSLRYALKPLVALFGNSRVLEFGPRKLAAVREEMIRLDWCRTSVNRQVHRIRRMFQWAASQELIPVAIYTALTTLSSLKQHRSSAKERPPVRPVPEESIVATMPFLTTTVQAMVQLQLLTGARPGEIANLQPRYVDRGNDPWIYSPPQHKTAWRGQVKKIYIGPRAQAILAPYLLRAPDAFCFDPRESVQEMREKRTASRKTPLKHGNSPGTNRKQEPQRVPTEQYNKDSYGRAIRRAAKRAKVPLWSPNQLRHSRGTWLRKHFGVEGASLILGHADLNTTLIYAEQDDAKAAEIAKQVG